MKDVKKVEVELCGSYWRGCKVNQYGIHCGYIDYRCLADAVGSMVLCNDIHKLNYARLEGVNPGLIEMETINGNDYNDETDTYADIFQYYIISGPGAQVLEKHTDEIVYYIDALDMYVWGVTYYGTSWDYVLTDIKIKGGC